MAVGLVGTFPTSRDALSSGNVPRAAVLESTTRRSRCADGSAAIHVSNATSDSTPAETTRVSCIVETHCSRPAPKPARRSSLMIQLTRRTTERCRPPRRAGVRSPRRGSSRSAAHTWSTSPSACTACFTHWIDRGAAVTTPARPELFDGADAYRQTVDEVAAALSTDVRGGLADTEPRARLERYGCNELTAAPPVAPWRRFIAQFKDTLVILLLVATATSLGLWAYETDSARPDEAIAILVVVLLNATMGYIQESRAEAAV